MADGSRDAAHRAFVAGILFYVLLMSAGYAMGLDGGSSSGGGTISQTVNPNAPRLIAFDMRYASNNSSAMGNQVDVLTGLHFWIQVNNTNGWASLTKLWVNLWYDAGNDSTSYDAASSAANYKINITYTNAGASSPTATQWALVGGNIAFVNSANVTTYTVQPNFEYAFRLSFQLHAQIHQAQKPTLSSSGYANAFSWNARFGANDLSNDINYTSKDPTAGTFYEFGVYQYTSISLASTTWTGASGAPGQTVLTNSITVTHSSNAAYWLNVTADGDLDAGNGHTIGITNVKVVHNAGQDDLSANTAFPGTAPRTVRLLGTGTNTPHAFNTTGDSETVPVQFQISIPLGTFAATYTATITVLVDQRKPPTT